MTEAEIQRNIVEPVLKNLSTVTRRISLPITNVRTQGYWRDLYRATCAFSAWEFMALEYIRRGDDVPPWIVDRCNYHAELICKIKKAMYRQGEALA